MRHASSRFARRCSEGLEFFGALDVLRAVRVFPHLNSGFRYKLSG
jgi:hypothetical protein